jgi:hypothetical protein
LVFGLYNEWGRFWKVERLQKYGYKVSGFVDPWVSSWILFRQFRYLADVEMAVMGLGDLQMEIFRVARLSQEGP